MRGLLLPFLAWLVGLVAATDPLVVELPHGKLRGRANEGYYSYESIPYAEPPVGELRLEPPQPYSQKWKEIFDASKPPVFCMHWAQFVEGEDNLIGQEDCLTVSVYKPNNKTRKTFPVIIEIHGGAFSFAISGERSQERLMASGNVMLVKFSYRVGPIGFLSSEDTTLPGNYGLKDQRLALRWIKKHIAAFGGEPENMVVIGLGAGGASVHLQMMHDEFKEVAKGAISVSGNALAPWVVQQGARQRAFEMGRIVGCGLLSDSAELKKCLKTKNATEIVRAVPEFHVFGYVPFTPFSPVVEPADAEEPFLTEHPVDIIRSGKFAHVPWAVSHTSGNGIYNAAQLLEKQCDGKESLGELNSRWYQLAPTLFFYRDTCKTLEEMDERSRQLRQQYLGDRKFTMDSYMDVQRMFTDLLFRNSTLQAIQLHQEHGKSPLYSIVYDNPADSMIGQLLSKRDDIEFGTGMAEDYFLVFPHPLRQSERPDEKLIGQKLLRMLEDFVQSDNGTLQYDSSPLPNNFGQKQVLALSIGRNHSKVITL